MRDTLLAVERTRACSFSLVICTLATAPQARAYTRSPSPSSDSGCRSSPWRRLAAPTEPTAPSNVLTWSWWATSSICCDPPDGRAARRAPWGNPHAAEYVEQIARITNAILVENQESLAILRALAARAKSACRAMLRAAHDRRERAAARPSADPLHGGQSRLVLPLAGSELQRPAADARSSRWGCANRPDRPFPHDIAESDDLLQTMRRHKVTARARRCLSIP